MTRRQLIEVVAGAAAVPVISQIPGEAEEKVGSVPPSTVKPILHHALPDMEGKEVTVATVTYAPGGSSLPHRHPGSVVGYVLEGELVMQMDGEPPVTYREGEIFYETPNQVHRVSRNASTTRPARLLAFLIADKGQPVTTPVKNDK